MHLREGESVEGVQIVSPAELSETHTAQTVVDGSTGYGLGWGVAEGPAGTVLAHSGGTAGFASQVFGVPSLDYGWVILTNSVEGSTFITAVGRHITELVLGLPPIGDADLLAAHAAQKAAFAALAAAVAPVEAEAVADYLGRYEHRLTVSHEADELVIETVYGALQFKAVPELEGVFVCTTNFFLGVLAQFSTDDRDQVTLSLGFGLENDAVVNPLVAARLDSAPRPHHPRRHQHQRAARELRAFDWHRLSSARRFRPARHRPNANGGITGLGLD
jgi:hypothetical protein